MVVGSGLLRRAKAALCFSSSQTRVLEAAAQNGELTLHNFHVSDRSFSLVQIPGGSFRTWHLNGPVGSQTRDAYQLFSGSGKLLPVSGSDHAAKGGIGSSFAVADPPSSKSSIQMGFCLEPWYGNFYHWLIWCAPRLLLLHHTLGVTNFYFPLGASRYPFIVQTMTLLGLNSDAIVEVPVGFHEAHTVAAVQDFVPHYSVYSLIAKCAVDASPFGLEHNTVRGYYLTRGDDVSNPRELANEDQIVEICRLQGLIALNPASLALAEQIRLFSSVSLLVGIHGAALSNMVWLPKGSHVLEIIVDDAQHFKTLAAQLGHSWIGIPSEVSSVAHHQPRLSVNPEFFKLGVEMALSQL